MDNRVHAALQELTLSMGVARHFAEAMTLLQRLEREPVNPATLAGANVEAVMRMNEVGFGLSADTCQAGYHRQCSALGFALSETCQHCKAGTG